MRPAAALTSIPLRFLECRDTKHEWKIEWWRRGQRLLKCKRCGTEKTEVLFATHGFKIEDRDYSYPPRYLVKSAIELDLAFEVRSILWDVKRNNGHGNGNGRK